MKILLSSLIFLFIQQAFSQEMIRKEISTEDPHNFYINDHDSTNLFYYKIVPKKQPIGVLVILPSGGESIENMLRQINLHQKALEQNFLVLLPSYNWGTIERLPEIEFFNTIFKQVVEEHKVPKDNFVFCGLSNGAMIALNYGIRAIRDSSTYLVPKGIIGLDPPLDLARLYRYCEREIGRDFSPAGVNEAKWLKSVYEQVYGGTPDSVPLRYQEASTFTYGAEKGGNAQYLNTIAIRMHSDLNIDFLVNQRKRDLHDWNGIDIVAFVNQLKINGNKRAEVIITQNKGKRLDDSLHPHSWSIMDTDDTIDWILSLFNDTEVKEDTKVQYLVDEILPKADYLEDWDQLIDSIRTHHPQAYEFISKDDFDYLANQTRKTITDSTTISQFSWACSSIISAIGCVHTNSPPGSVLKLSSDMFFPVKVRFIDSNLYVIAPYTPNTELVSGVEVLKINGIDVLDIKNEIAAHIPSDGYNQSFVNTIINNYFGYFSAFPLNFPSDYEVEIKANGRNKKIQITREKEEKSTPSSSISKIKDLDFSIESSKNMATITIRSFVYYNEHFTTFKSFIDSCFSEIEFNRIENIVLDLRNNGGGDPYCAAYLLQYISEKPFRYYKKGTTSVYKELEKKIKPFKNKFSGHLYTLINGRCASTSGHLCSILKQNNLGVLVGSETGATYSCNAKTIHFGLKNTGIRVSVATKSYQTAVTGLVKHRGIMPDYKINRNLEDILSKKDLELEKVLELILK